MMLLLILAVLVPLWVRMRKDFVGALCYAIVILLTFPTVIRIEMPGSLPQLTVQRLVILSLFVGWFSLRDRRPIREVPFRGLMAGWACLALVSLIGAVDQVAGIKRYLEFVLELFVFYFILATTLKDRADAFRLLRSAVIGISIVASLAIAERYTGINVVDRFIGADPEASYGRDVRVTYRHRILLGAGMAMGFPLAMAMIHLASTKARRWLAWMALAMMMAACYYAMSRGPWLAAFLAVAVMIVFGTVTLRKPLMILGTAALLILVARPGVLETLSGYASATVNTDSFKGGTFQYRLELWTVAWNGISHSPWRLLLGNGPAAGLNRSIDWKLSYRGRDYNIESWDNDLAYSLFQYGILGLIITLTLYGRIAWQLLATARASPGVQRDIYVCLCASAVVLLFMLSNVHIFARQLYYLFWALTAIGFALAHPATESDESSGLSEASNEADMELQFAETHESPNARR